MDRVLNNLQFDAQIVADFEEAKNHTGSCAFDLVICDWTNADGLISFQNCLRGTPSHNALVFPIVQDTVEMKQALQAGAGFVMYRPASAQAGVRPIRAAYGFLVQRRRKTLRIPLNLAGVVMHGAVRANVRILDASEGGVCVSGVPELAVSESVSLSFSLPKGGLIKVLCQVRWKDGADTAGLQFTQMDHGMQNTFDSWILDELGKRMHIAPGIIDRSNTPTSQPLTAGGLQ